MNMNKKKGFTLIELLVVIAIIALLLAILMPSLKKVKERAKQTICMTNLRGIGLAVQLYVNDHDNRTAPKHGNGYAWTHPATGEEVAAKDAYWGMAYNDYAKNPKIFSCSTFSSMKSTIYTLGDGDIMGGYGINRYFKNMKVTSIRTPATFIVAHDHVEPQPDLEDLFYIHNPSYGYNLEEYRTEKEGRSKYYTAIFRHSKKSSSLDDSPNDPARLANTINNPNGKSNTLWLDGSVSPMNETTGENVPKSWYTGK
jgi:prepilin-type N-terminal cleavage/methylation domain-containing protein/prepilin-type processing-associated H-X9-DG protein